MFKVNGASYQVGIETLQRSVANDYKYDITTCDGKRHRELRAAYRTYTLSLGNMNPTSYDALYEVLSAGMELTVSFPWGQNMTEFTACVTSLSDALEFIERDGTHYFGGLSVTFEETQPMEVSG